MATAYYPVGIYWSDYGIAIPTKLNNQNVEIKFSIRNYKEYYNNIYVINYLAIINKKYHVTRLKLTCFTYYRKDVHF